MEFSRITTDVLVIGGGLAGLSAALAAMEAGRKVVIVAKSKVARSGNTLVARNNLAAVIDAENNESLALHLADTLNGGAGLNDPQLVSILVREAREGINWLRDLGVPFVEEGGQLVVSLSQGHSCPRTVNADGKGFSDRVPGLALTLPLGRQLESRGVDILNDVLIYALIRQGDSVAGALGLDRSSPHLYLIQAGAVILASGGAGRIYASSTNTSDITGDGYVMAARAGAKVIDMEFVQFNPVVTIDSPKLTMQASPFAAGAELKNQLGEVFMDIYSPAGHMATRDVMARAILAEINAGRGTPKGGVYMDFSKIPSALLKKKWHNIHNFLQGRQQVEVAPAAHFIMGGIAIDEECRSTMPGLYACGEVAGGVHGANRLPGNALTEAVVFGRRAGRRASAEVRSPICWGTAEVDQILLSERICLDEIEDGRPAQGSPEISAVKAQLRQVMGSCAGVLRSTRGLENASKKVQELYEILEQYRCNSYWEWLDFCQVRLMVGTAIMILDGALGRKENLGAHYVDI